MAVGVDDEAEGGEGLDAGWPRHVGPVEFNEER